MPWGALAGAALSTAGSAASSGKSGGSAPAGNTTSTQTNAPWGPIQPYLEGLAGDVSNLVQRGGPQYYPDATYAPQNDWQKMALQRMSSLAFDEGQPIIADATSAARRFLDPSFLRSNPGNAIYESMANGPQQQAAIAAAVANATPGLLDTFTRGSRLASPAAAYSVAQGVANAAAPYVFGAQRDAAQGLSTNYSTAANQQNQALALSPQIMQMPWQNLMQGFQAGTMQQGFDQAAINDQVARWNYSQSAPYNVRSWAAGMYSGMPGSSSSLSSPYFTQPDPGFGGLLSAGVSGASLGNMVYNKNGWFGGMGGATGGAAP